jgi:phage baseplate assembly protein W
MTAMVYGYNPPFIGGPQNVLSRQEDEQIIKNDLLQLLLTVPGERVMRPDYGVNLRNAVFELNDTQTVSTLITEIRQQIELHDKRIIVDDVQIETDESENGMTVRIFARMRRDLSRYIDVEQFISFANGS